VALTTLEVPSAGRVTAAPGAAEDAAGVVCVAKESAGVMDRGGAVEPVESVVDVLEKSSVIVGGEIADAAAVKIKGVVFKVAGTAVEIDGTVVGVKVAEKAGAVIETKGLVVGAIGAVVVEIEGAGVVKAVLAVVIERKGAGVRASINSGLIIMSSRSLALSMSMSTSSTWSTTFAFFLGPTGMAARFP
jgi:hypothetical protein